MGATQLADPQHTGPQGRRSQCAGAWRGSTIQLHGRVRGIADCQIAPVSVPFGGEKDSDAKSTGGGG